MRTAKRILIRWPRTGKNHVASSNDSRIIHSASKNSKTLADLWMLVTSLVCQSVSTVPHSKLADVETSVGAVPSVVTIPTIMAVITITASIVVIAPIASSVVGDHNMCCTVLPPVVFI